MYKWNGGDTPSKKLSIWIWAGVAILCSISATKTIYAQGLKNSFTEVGDLPIIIIIATVIIIGCVWGVVKRWRRRELKRLDWIRAMRGRGKGGTIPRPLSKL